MVKYVDESFTVINKPVPRHGGILQLLPGQSSGGYGNKISTDRVLSFPGDKRLYRIYAICHSNVASHYIIRNGENLFLRDGDLP